ncbi:CAP domain-containing protein [Gemmobacter fulvus]|uniref:CAP domain-containing protein n=1 Tax=Gemmobacter fulvus TaxID=2840474 RepID=UPI002796D835|nr:CAP domain-containing protein [Gemmobacter fulvus]MDQ1846812.1 CAP domain-containing protein [Gemmobacter fulvus]
MTRFSVLAVCAAAMLAACSTTAPEAQFGADGRPLPRVYKIDKRTEGEIAYRVLDSVNSLRAAKGVVQMQLNPQLNAAAAAHSRDMSAQNRPWHFGSDGSSPLLRVQRAGYGGHFGGELISETYETELETLAAWANQPDTRAIILDANANEMGFAWFQEPSGKIWWTLVTGDSTRAPVQNVNAIALGRTVTSEMDNVPAQ